MYGWPIINSRGWKWNDREGCFVPPGENYTLFSHYLIADECIEANFLGLEAWPGQREAIEGPAQDAVPF